MMLNLVVWVVLMNPRKQEITMDIDPELLADLRDPQLLAQDFYNLRQYWLPRDNLIREFRKFMAGMNQVEAPKSARYKVRIMHTYMLAGIISEKNSRYLNLPEIQVVINDPLDELEREQSSKQERCLNAAQYEMERMGDGDVWDRVKLDAITVDGGVERIERMQAALWPQLIALEANGTPMEEPQRTTYKKEKGWPIRATYVPLEYCYPNYAGSWPQEVFEVEPRSLYSVLHDPMFKGRAEVLKDQATKDNTRDCVILHYDTPTYHAYYAMLATPTAMDAERRSNREWVATATGELVLLYAYKHNLGRVQYNFVGGRYGGWKTANGGIIDIGKGILHQNSVADEVASMVLTNIRATSWPTFKIIINPELRGQPTTGSPAPLAIQEGQDVTLYTGEDILPIVEPKQNEVVPWFFDFVRQNINNLGGSPVLVGENQPGVRTGYHEAQQISQAEGIDQKIEEHLAFGAIQRGTLMMLHVKEMKEECWAHYIEKEPGTRSKLGNYLSINPKELTPLPRLDARVRKPRPVDAVASIRAARDATDDRGGKGPLLCDDTALTNYMGVDEPDIEEKKKLVESQKRAVVQNGLLTDKIAEALNLKLAQSNIPDLNENKVNSADPALVNAVSQIAPQSAQAGGVNPHTLAQVATANNGAGGVGLQTGQAPGQSQPEANVGTAVAGALT